MSILTKRKECKYCGFQTDSDLVRNIIGNGASQVFWKCLRCKRNSNGGGYYLDQKKIIDYGIKIEDIPVEADLRIERCAVCGELEVENHHYAPRHLFGDDADKWPTGWLCRNHHTEWHHRVTPNMRGKNGRLQDCDQ